MTGSNDVIATLSARVSDLSKRVGLLQAELDGANRRLAVYEENDGTIQDAISGALRAAYTIRERAETTAEQVLEQAREERRLLLKEIERLRDERDNLQEEIATQRRSGIAAVTPRPLSSDTVASELRAVAGEALRGLFQEIVEDMRAAPHVREQTRAVPPAPVVEEEEETPSAPPTPRAEPMRAEPMRAEPMRAEPTWAEPARAQPVPAEPPRIEAPPVEAPRVEPARAEAVRAEQAAEPAPTYEYMSRLRQPRIEEEEVAPSATATPVDDPWATAAPPPSVAPAPPPLEVVPPAQSFEIAPARVEAATPTSDIQVVLSPIASFPRLVEIERHIQALPVVRTLYVRDFRGGAATLAVALRSAMTPEEFAGMLAGLQQPRLRLVSGSRNTIELRIEGEAGVA